MNLMSRSRLVLPAIVAFGIMLLARTTSANERPNIILIMADDFGYEAVSANGGSPYKTPQLDKLAAEGLRFSNCVAQPLCTPTRVKIMTGRYNFRNYTQFGVLDPDETTFGHVMRRAGYATGIAGKWQLGRDRKLIDHFGFDEYCLWWLENKSRRYNNVGELIQNGKVLPGGKGEYGPDVVCRFVLDFISRHKDGPFFCYYPMILAHSPFEPTPDSPAGMTKENAPVIDRMAEMVSYTDKIVGQIVSHLEALEIRDNTVLLFIGDNGTDRCVRGSRLGEHDWPGGKGCNFVEMGMRVPLIASYPAGGVHDVVVDDPVDLADFLPTIAELGQAGIPDDLQVDGHSFAGRLAGTPTYSPHPWAYVGYYSKRGQGPYSHFARTDRFKLYEGGYLFDFVADPGHSHPISLETATGEQRDAHKILSGVLERMKAQFPAADRSTGRKTKLIDTRPGMQNIKPKTEAEAAQT